MENKVNITEYLMKNHGFNKLHVSSREDKLDFEKFTCARKIHIIHYLFYSELHKHFSIGVKHENPKKDQQGRLLDWTFVSIPKVIYSIKDVDKLINSIC